MGGGPGGPIPYRIYIDGGVVLVCVIALAPQSPLVGECLAKRNYLREFMKIDRSNIRVTSLFSTNSTSLLYCLHSSVAEELHFYVPPKV